MTQKAFPMGLNKELSEGLPFCAGNWWFDEKGREHLNEPLGPKTENWFLRQTGQVKVELKPHLLEVTWDTHHVHPEAIQAVMDQLEEMNMDVKVHIHFFYHGWSYEKYQDTIWASERIEEIQECKSVAVIHRTRISDCTISDVMFASNQIKAGYLRWERTRGQLVQIDQGEISQMMPKALIFGLDGTENNLVFSWIGQNSAAAKVYGNDWVVESAGKINNRSFGDESQQFADRVNAGIAKTMLSGEPFLQHIRAIVSREAQEPFWISYERLLTRYYLSNGAPVVFSDVYLTQHVDISLAGGP